jgi:SpoVK/Ycf46/Vps4 family AAA+-type ATPase
MISIDRVKKLLQAYRDFDDTAFLRAAEAIIEESVASNRMSEAKELKRALGEGHRPVSFKTQQMNLLPSATRSDAKLFTLVESAVDERQIVLSKETREKIDRVVQEHKNKEILHRHGLRAKSKLLFWGPPGCGKTLTSMFLGNALGLPVAVVQLSALISSNLGDTGNHVRKVFDYANNNPVVLLLDEFDAIGKSRDDRQDVGEVRRVVNSILQAFDSFSSDRSIIVAASNYQDVLDEALWRRFDDIVSFPKPSKVEVEILLKKLTAEISIQGSLSAIALQMKSLSFAEIERVIHESIKSVVMKQQDEISADEIRTHLRLYTGDVNRAKKSKTRK